MNVRYPGRINAMLVLLGCLILPDSIVQAEIYKWIDANGKVHFSDKPTVNNKSQQTVKPKDTLTTITIDTEKSEAIAKVYSSSKRKIKPSPRRFVKPKNKIVARGMTEEDINQRIKQCESERWSDCSKKEIIRKKGVEDYYSSPEGIRQSQLNRDRRMREQHEQRLRQYGVGY